METLRLCNFCRFGARSLEFGTVVSNIILPWIRNFGTILTTLKIPQNPQKHFEYGLMETLRLYNFCKFGATLLGFGTVFTNIIVHGIRNFGKNRITLTP